MRAVTRRGRGGMLAALVATVTMLALTACSGGAGGASGSSGTGLSSATELTTPVAKPALVLTDTEGKAYDLVAETAGRVTLLYFGYTHCPDVCPTTMADIALALKSMPVVAGKITVVFITSDPARDTPAVLKSWLAHFDTDFVGLTGSVKAIYAAADSVGVPLEPPVREPDGTYTVAHGAQVLAFGTDNKAHVVFTAGAGSEGYDHDLPLIVENRF